MHILRFLRRGRDSGLREWHHAWQRAVEALDREAPARLESELNAHAAADARQDCEVEQEMLQALRDLLTLEAELAVGRLPSLETSHRVALGEPCHFSAPVSLPDADGQPTGRLLLTSGRAALAGGVRTPALPWHAVRHVVRSGRDVIFVRAAADEGTRLRCNSFSDALCACAIARTLIQRRGRKPL